MNLTKEIQMSSAESLVMGKELASVQHALNESKSLIHGKAGFNSSSKDYLKNLSPLSKTVGNYSWYPGGFWQPANCKARWKVSKLNLCWTQYFSFCVYLFSFLFLFSAWENIVIDSFTEFGSPTRQGSVAQSCFKQKNNQAQQQKMLTRIPATLSPCTVCDWYLTWFLLSRYMLSLAEIPLISSLSPDPWPL